MATAFRFSEAEEKPPVTILQRSLSAPTQEEPNNTFLAAMMAAGGNVGRSVSVSEYGKSLAGAGSPPNTNVPPQPSLSSKSSSASSVVPAAAIPSEVDTSLNEDLFYASVSAAAAVTLSPSFGPSSGSDNGNDIFYPGYLGQGSSTWGRQKKQEEMPALGLPISAETGSQSSQSPRSTEYHLRLPNSSSNTNAQGDGDLYQLRAAMAGMQLGGSGNRSGSTASGMSQQQQLQMQQQAMNAAAMYDPSQLMGYFPENYGGMYPPGQYMQPGYNRYGGEMYGQHSISAPQGGRGAAMMDQRYAYGSMYGPTNGYQMQMPEYNQTMTGPANGRGMNQGQYHPRGGNPYAGNSGGGSGQGVKAAGGPVSNGGRSKHQNHSGNGASMNSSSQPSLQQQQQLWIAQQQQGFVDDGYHNGNNHHHSSGSRSSSSHTPARGSMLEDLRTAMRASSASQRHRVVMGATSQVGNYSRGAGATNNGANNLYVQHPSSNPLQPASANNAHHHHHHHGSASSIGGPGGSAPYTLSDVRGHAVEFAQDQFGSRWLQQQLSSTAVAAEDKQALFLELLPSAKELAGDTFGNYCVQILLNPQVGTPEQQLALCQTAFEGNILTLSRNTYACRCIQSLVKLFQLGDAVIPLTLQDKMLHELEKDIISLVTDSNANHVAQQIIERVRPIDRIRFVLDAFKGKYILLAKDPYGCRVCQRVLEYATPEYVEPALEELLSDIDDLVTDSMGNYVVQHIITASGDRYGPQRTRLVEAIKRNLLMFATHKFASNVVEKVLEYGDAHTRREIIGLMLDGHAAVAPGVQTVPMLQLMMSDLFANYVCQRSLAVAERDQLIRLVAIVRASAHELRRMTYGKHILSACEKAAAAAGIP